MFNENDYTSEMDLNPHTIYIDIRERGRIEEFIKYLHKLKHTKEDDIYRVTTSNGEYFYYKSIDKCKLLKGDFYYNGILFEFKSFYDLKNSIMVNNESGRLNQQIDDVLKDPSINQYIIISPLLSNYDFKSNKSDREDFENIKNFFNQFIHRNVHFIPTTSQEIAFRDMINIWRCGQSPNNLFTLNKKYPLNPFLSNLSLIPCLNHNNLTAIFKEYPYTMASDIHKLTVEMLQEVKFGKKRCGEKKASKIIRQRDILFPTNFDVFKNTSNNLSDYKIRQEVWNTLKQGGEI